jgi:outer membrane putative beta-barrel porin/alpha-amylase
MIGDLGPLPRTSVMRLAGGAGLPTPFPPPTPPGVPRPRGATLVIPSIRGIKISENQSPRPQDRVYFTFNYFQGVNDQVNQRLQSPIGYTQVFRYIGGFEKTFLDGQGSVGFRVPLDSVTAATASSRASGNFGGTSTAIGDMSIYGKYILLENREKGDLLSAGLAITVPTGPGRFAGFDTYAPSPHTPSFQPFLGYIYNTGRLYFHGFGIVDVTTTGQNPVLLYNDFGLGYFIRRPDPNGLATPLISTIAPTFEVHVTDPLNHRNPYSLRDPAGMTDIVNLTYGLNIGIFDRTLVTFGVVTPVTSPKPFDFEAMAFVNYFFGPRPRRQLTSPPVLGGF